jgi:hypothetical protein
VLFEHDGYRSGTKQTTLTVPGSTMSEEEAEDVDLAPRNLRKHENRKGVIGAAVKVSETQEAVSVARIAMIASPILFTIIIGPVGAMYADFDGSQIRGTSPSAGAWTIPVIENYPAQ